MAGDIQEIKVEKDGNTLIFRVTFDEIVNRNWSTDKAIMALQSLISPETKRGYDL